MASAAALQLAYKPAIAPFRAPPFAPDFEAVRAQFGTMTTTGIRTRSRRLAAFAPLLALGLTLSPAAAYAQSAGAPGGPQGCVPFGTAQLPPGLPSGGGQFGLDNLPAYDGEAAPSRVDLRTPRTQFNRFYEFALVDGAMLTRPRSEEPQPWRHVPTPSCLR